MTDGLKLIFMGPPEILSGGPAVKFATRKALALFAYLVVESGAHPREKLMNIFWPESETHLAQSALRNTLVRIKEALRSVHDPLQMEADRVRINPAIASSLDLDLVAQASAESTPTKGPQPDISQLERAAEACRGPFLDGLSLPDAPAFDEWLAAQRTHWGHRQNLVYDRLSLLQLENHLIQPAIETVIRWIILDRFNETAYQRLMRLHFLNGDRSSALQTYETCRDVLEQELGVKPSPDTEKILEHIRSSQTPAPVFSTQAEAQNEALVIPFVGRSHEYQGLVQLFQLARKGKPQVTVISGESGIGKTRLSDEFLSWAVMENADFLRGRAFETARQLLPYQSIIDALRVRLERENAPDDLLDDTWLVELTRLLPELRERYPDLPLPIGDESTARTRLFEAIARLVEALSARKPLIWLLDDLHWADAETLELLRYLAHTWKKARTPILLLVLMRTEALGHGTGLRDWMSILTRDIEITRFNLSAMSAADLEQLIAALAGENAPGSSELCAWLTEETSGQPFFLTETLTALDEYGALIWSGKPPARKLDIPGTLANLKSLGPQNLAPAIRDIVLSRLDWLSQSASSMLSAAAVIGRNCSFGLLSQVSGTDEQASLNALDELLAARMVIETRNESRPYAVSHDRIREVVYAQLSTARQQVFHRRVMSVLTEKNAPAAELALHALSAKEWPSAFEFSIRAGDEAMRLYAVEGALRHYEAARTLFRDKKVDVESEMCQHLYARLGKAYELEHHHREALNIYEEMQLLASERGSREMELAAIVARCTILPWHYDTQDIELAIVLAQQALPLAQELGNLKAQVDIEISLAETHKFGDGQIEASMRHFHAAEKLARKAGLHEQLGFATLELGVAFLWSGELEQAEQFLLESVAIFRTLNQQHRVLSGLHNLAILHMESGRTEEALDLLQQAYQANKVLGSSTSVYALATTQNIIHILRGEYDQAFETLQPVMEIHEGRIVSGLWIDIFQQLAWCYYDLGAYTEGLKYCQKAIDQHDHINMTGHSAAFAMLALLLIKSGEIARADEAVKSGWKNFDPESQSYPGWWETISILEAEAELALAKGELERAARCVRQLLKKYDELKLGHFKPGILFLQARVALAGGREKAAYRTLSQALVLADKTGAHREVWGMCSELGKLEAKRGNESAWVRYLERACVEIKFIADHAGTAELRKIFLSRPDVRNLLRL